MTGGRDCWYSGQKTPSAAWTRRGLGPERAPEAGNTKTPTRLSKTCGAATF